MNIPVILNLDLTIFMLSPNVLRLGILENLLSVIFNNETSCSCCSPFLWKQLFTPFFFLIFVVLSIVSTTYCFGRDLIYLLVRVCVYMGECKHDGEEACGSVLTHRDRKGLCLLFHYCPLIYLRQRLSLNLGCRFAQLAWRPESSFRSPFSALLGIEATGRCEREA